jgi:uncharacterized protein YegP (UPF0339 family)
MAGHFELVDAPDGGYRLRLIDGSGAVVAVSVTFPTKRAAVAGVVKVREIGGTGLIRDRSYDRQSAPYWQQILKQHAKPAKKSLVGSAGHGQLAAAGRRAVTSH